MDIPENQIEKPVQYPWEESFFKALEETRCVSTAAETAGIYAQLVYSTAARDRRFSARFNRARKKHQAKDFEWQPVFLESLQRTASIPTAAEEADISAEWVYACRRNDPEFKEAFDKALEEALLRYGPHKRKPRPWEHGFLSALKIHGNVKQAAEDVGIGPNTPYAARNSWPDFAEAFDLAMEEFADSLEAEAVRRARDGLSKVVLYQGRPVLVWVDAEGNVVPEGTEGATQAVLKDKEYSDSVLLALLKAARPYKYRENYKVDTTHDNPDTVILAHIAKLVAAAEGEGGRVGFEEPEPLRIEGPPGEPEDPGTGEGGTGQVCQ